MEPIQTAIENGVAVLTLNNPSRMNALSLGMTDRLLILLQEIAQDSSVGVVVLTGAGRGFCAGGDVKAMAEGGSSLPEAAVARLRARAEVSRLLHEIPKITIAMVNGPAAGAGLSLALACDMRIAGASARFSTSFVKVGLSGDFGCSYFLKNLVGSARARELFFSGEMVDAERALTLGMVNRVVADENLASETLAYAQRLAQGPRIAYGHMKRALNAADSATLAEVLDIECFGQVRCRNTDDHKEAARAFVERRPPVFNGS
ncbi:enoyl-CoA hydratase [Comamonadaceae bacterium G21597-S1]|nr:enoyl-CoA hydratase [Comamonadaceae bacterium G21597-S1]